MKTIEDSIKPNRRLVLAVVVSVCIIALFGAIQTVGAKESTAITPDVVGMTVADAEQAFADSGFTQVPVLHAPGITDPAHYPYDIVTKQIPEAGKKIQTSNLCGIWTDPGKKSKVNGPVTNPYLASSLYAITHFDSSQSDSTPYGPPRGKFTVDPTKEPIVYGGPINIITLASTNKNYMWASRHRSRKLR